MSSLPNSPSLYYTSLNRINRIQKPFIQPNTKQYIEHRCLLLYFRDKVSSLADDTLQELGDKYASIFQVSHNEQYLDPRLQGDIILDKQLNLTDLFQKALSLAHQGNYTLTSLLAPHLKNPPQHYSIYTTGGLVSLASQISDISDQAKKIAGYLRSNPQISLDYFFPTEEKFSFFDQKKQLQELTAQKMRQTIEQEILLLPDCYAALEYLRYSVLTEKQLDRALKDNPEDLKLVYSKDRSHSQETELKALPILLKHATPIQIRDFKIKLDFALLMKPFVPEHTDLHSLLLSIFPPPLTAGNEQLPDNQRVDHMNKFIDTYSDRWKESLELTITNSSIHTMTNGLIKTFPKLKKATYSYNPFPDFPLPLIKNLLSAPSLKEIDLSHNEFTEFPIPLLEQAPSLHSLDLSGNLLDEETKEDLRKYCDKHNITLKL